MRILVTGGKAFIGIHLCRRLLAEGHTVYVLTRGPSDGGDSGHGEGEALPRFIKGDLLDHRAIQKIVHDCRPDAVFHLASMRMEHAPEGDARFVLRVNGEGTYNLLEACVALPQTPIMIYASAMGVYNYEDPSYLPMDESHPAIPADTYGLSKLMGELACEFFKSRSRLTCSILRISGVFGPGKPKGIIYNCLNALMTGGVVRLSKGEIKRDLVYVSDVVDALIRAMQSTGRGRSVIYNIGSGVGASLMDVVRATERVTGCDVPVELLPDTRNSPFHFDIGKAEREIGFRPRSLEVGIDEFWKFLIKPSS